MSETKHAPTVSHLVGAAVAQELFSALTGLMIALVGGEFADDIPAVVAARAAIATAKANGMILESGE